MRNTELEKVLNSELNSHAFKDYAPNGLQVEGRPTVQKIVTGVTASQALIDAAIELDVDALLVHHGYFWKNESSVITGIKKNRLKALLENDINLYAYHLPLDAHPTLGNNIQLGQLLGIQQLGTLLPEDNLSLLLHGQFDKSQTVQSLTERLETVLGRRVLHCGDNAPEHIRHIAWCTGGGQDFIQQAAEQGAHAFITGEVSERTIHIAREMGIHFFSAGHHATERYGIKALGEWLTDNYDMNVTFIDIDNPA
jgi:dinuclear metal center YbgI/SA1388 family protein